MPANSRSWTTLAGLRALSLRAWSSGALLRELLEPTGVYPRRRPLKRPTAGELLSEYAAARDWAGELIAGAGSYSVETAEVGRNTIGSNRLPAGAVFATVEDEIAFIGKIRDSLRFRGLAEVLLEIDAGLRPWAAKRPLLLLELGDAALAAARVALWMRDNPTPGIYVRQLSLPGVHTKFVEGHRRIIEEMLFAVRAGGSMVAEAAGGQPPEIGDADDRPDTVLGVTASADPRRTSAARFASRHGFAHPPELVRFRILDPELSVLGDAKDITVTAEAFSTLRLPVTTVIVTENQVNFLALPERLGTLALFGGGYGFTSLRDASWLKACKILYWGDIDTHGFRILDQLRAAHPRVSSVLMDEDTLLAYRDAWSTEPTPSRAELTRLTPEEAALYAALGNDSYGQGVRLEQELIRWDWALERLGFVPG